MTKEWYENGQLKSDSEENKEWYEGGHDVVPTYKNQVLVQKCNDPLKWYADQVGLVVNIIGEDLHEYKARDKGGYVNFISKDDAIRV